MVLQLLNSFIFIEQSFSPIQGYLDYLSLEMSYKSMMMEGLFVITLISPSKIICWIQVETLALLSHTIIITSSQNKHVGKVKRFPPT